MPIYCFTCDSCGGKTDVLRSISVRETDVRCSCDNLMTRDLGREQGRRGTGEFHTPIEMFSVGMNADEVPAFRQSLPNVEVREGLPIVKTRQEKMQVLKYFGFQEVN